MLSGKRITVSSDTLLDDLTIATHGAVIKEDGTVSFYSRKLNQEMCKKHREVVRADQAEFEDYVYKLHDQIQGEVKE